MGAKAGMKDSEKGGLTRKELALRGSCFEEKTRWRWRVRGIGEWLWRSKLEWDERV